MMVNHNILYETIESFNQCIELPVRDYYFKYVPFCVEMLNVLREYFVFISLF